MMHIGFEINSPKHTVGDEVYIRPEPGTIGPFTAYAGTIAKVTAVTGGASVQMTEYGTVRHVNFKWSYTLRLHDGTSRVCDDVLVDLIPTLSEIDDES